MATPHDLDELTEISQRLHRESPTYLEVFEPDAVAARKFLEMSIVTGSCPHILAIVDGRIAGVISYSLDASFSDNKCAVMGECYALPEYRGTPVGRALVMMAFELARGDGAKAMHIPIAGGHQATATLKNCLRKFGAEEIGVIMRKVL